ncbi:hypothetical protein ACFQUU_10670 [Herbaspirillum sp. GCM10030257]|uniref:hypothetical protein n=1 Tax=Herbaspirillum sp. GCM10030257 TaxID=3273393 RepID=UPI0036076A21
MSKVANKHVVEILTTHKMRTRNYDRAVAFDVSSLNRDSWFRILATRLSEQSKFKKESTSDIVALHYGYQLAVADSECNKVLNLHPDIVGKSEMRRFFTIFEQNLINSGRWSKSVKDRISTYFRKYVFDLAGAIPFRNEISKRTVRFSTKMYLSSLPRAMISDLEHVSFEGTERREPLGAITHTTLDDLHKKGRIRVESDLKLIIDACISELKLWETAREKLNQLSKLRFSADEIRIGKQVVKSGSESVLSKFEITISPERRLGIYAKLARELKVHSSVDKRVSFPTIRTLLPQVLGLTVDQLAGAMPRNILFLPERMSSNELIAVFVLLLCYTGWNSNSLINLTTERIKEGGRTVTQAVKQAEIQGYKSKTDDDTPSTVLDSTLPRSVYAINLLLWNLTALRQFGIVEKNERRLWFSYSVGRTYPYREQYIGFQNALEHFIKKYRLPHFSFDQIRTQVLLAEQLRSKDVETVRRIAGHSSISTTGRYLEHEFMKRISSSINLEFSRRLEATVIFRMGATLAGKIPHFDERYIDEKLLVPIGDGTSCADPKTPPFEEYIKNEICTGTACHLGDGCPQRRMVITRTRIEELVRKRTYYAKNWGRLMDQNASAFEKIHAPSILFTYGLYDFLANGPYANVLRQIEKRVKETS